MHAQSVAEPVRILKLDEDQRLVFGIASISALVDGSLVVDSQGDQIEPDTLERAAYEYVLQSRDGGVMHERTGVARIVESFVITKQKCEALGISEDLPLGWWIGMKVDDERVWKRVKDGELRAFSIGGTARRVQVEVE